MSYEVTLRKGEQTDTVIVSRVEMLPERIYIFKGFDPSQCPSEMRDDIVFASKELSGMILSHSDVEVVKAEPTDKKPNRAKPTF